MMETTKTSIPAKRRTDSAEVRTLSQPRRISKLTKDCHFHRTYALVAVVVVAHQNTAPLLSTLHKRVVGVGEPWMHSHSTKLPTSTIQLCGQTHTHTRRENSNCGTGRGCGDCRATRCGHQGYTLHLSSCTMHNTSYRTRDPKKEHKQTISRE